MREREPVERLLSDVEWGLAHDLEPRDLIPMLEKLVRQSEAESPARMFGARQLAELLVRQDPWRAARLVSEVLAQHDDERSWAVLGLAHTLQGNYRSAAKAYRRAISLAPDCPWYAHNLGHLLDVALDRPADALRLLEAAHRSEPNEVEIATSYAHALARAGHMDKARAVVGASLGTSGDESEAVIQDWLSRDPPGSLKPTEPEPADDPLSAENP